MVLRVILVFNGIMTLCAMPAVFLPTSMMDSMHQELGLGEMPTGPIVEYLARSVSGFYAAFGSMSLVLAYDVRRFAPLVTWWGATAVVFGFVLLWIDQVALMPPFWTWSEGPYLVLTGLLLLCVQLMSREAAS